MYQLVRKIACIALFITSYECEAQLLVNKAKYSDVLSLFSDVKFPYKQSYTITQSTRRDGSITIVIDSPSIGGIRGSYNLNFTEDSSLYWFSWTFGLNFDELNVKNLKITRKGSRVFGSDSVRDASYLLDSTYVDIESNGDARQNFISVADTVLTCLEQILGNDLIDKRIITPTTKSYFFDARSLGWDGYFYVFIGNYIRIEPRKHTTNWDVYHNSPRSSK